MLEDEEITFHRMEYDIESVIEKIEAKNLPDMVIRILRKGEVVP